MRFLSILLFALLFQTAAFAQIDQEKLQEELEKMQKITQEQLKNLNFDQLPFDSLFAKGFKFPDEFNGGNFILPDDIDINGILKMMEQQMGQIDLEGMVKMMEESMSKIDISEMEKMLAPFMKGELFGIPIPQESQPEEIEEDTKKSKKEKRKEKRERKKKQKTYKM